MDNPEPFDRAHRAHIRGRAAPCYDGFAFLKDAAAGEIVARLEPERFDIALDLGSHDGRLGARLPAAFVVSADPALAFARALPSAVVCDEDRLPFAAGSFDLVASALSLHSVNDLPGALVQVRRALKPGGRFIATLVAGETLTELRSALIAAETGNGGAVSPRVLPMVDPAQGAGLLARAGFTDPVADIDRRTVRYSDFAALRRDLTGMGEGNILAARERRPLPRATLRAVVRRLDSLRGPGGKLAITVDLLHLSARAPG